MNNLIEIKSPPPQSPPPLQPAYLDVRLLYLLVLLGDGAIVCLGHYPLHQRVT